MSTERAASAGPAPGMRTAAEVCAGLRLDRAAQALLEPAMTPRAYVEALLRARLHVPAIDVVAHTLPRRLGVWWAMLCAQHATAAEALPPQQENLFRLALRWLREPAEHVRGAAEEAGREAGAGSLGGLLGLAAGMSARPEGASLVANAVKLATVRAPAAAIIETQRAYAVLGLHCRLPPTEQAERRPSKLSCV